MSIYHIFTVILAARFLVTSADCGREALDSSGSCAPGCRLVSPLSNICSPADPGYYSPIGSSDQFPCGPGFFSSSKGATTCLPCPSGSISNRNTGATACAPCAPGSFADETGSSSCTACNPLYYNGPGANSATLASNNEEGEEIYYCMWHPGHASNATVLISGVVIIGGFDPRVLALIPCLMLILLAAFCHRKRRTPDHKERVTPCNKSNDDEDSSSTENHDSNMVSSELSTSSPMKRFRKDGEAFTEDATVRGRAPPALNLSVAEGDANPVDFRSDIMRDAQTDERPSASTFSDCFVVGSTTDESSDNETAIWIDEVTGLPIDPVDGPWVDVETGLPMLSAEKRETEDGEESRDNPEPSTWGTRHAGGFRAPSI